VINEHKKACIRYRIFPKIEAGAEAVWAETDEKWIVFVLGQLVTNAIKYSKPKEGAKTLTVTVRETEDECRVIVKDEGIGIAEQDMPRLFDAFFTGENGRRVSESTGMGLYLAKQICNRLGHRLEVASVLGEGTSVTLIVPRQTGIHSWT
jgi:signal transduction histidine kinase